MHQVLLDYLIEVLFINIGVPDAFRVDDDYRTLFATVETACLVYANPVLACKAHRLDLAFHIFTHLGRTTIGTTGLATLSLIDTEKDMIPVIGHDTRFKLQ